MGNSIKGFKSTFRQMDNRIRYALFAFGLIGVLLVGVGVGIGLGRDNPDLSGVDGLRPPNTTSVPDGPTNAPTSEAASPTSAPPTRTTGMGIGDTATDGNWEFTVIDVKQGEKSLDTGLGYTEANGEFVVVIVTIKNIGSAPAYFSETGQVLYDDAGNRYSPDTEGTLAVARDVGSAEIPPGQSVETAVAWDVPIGTEVPLVEWHDPDPMGSSPGAVVSLTK